MIITPADMIQSRKMFDAWDDLRFPATSIRSGANAPTWDATHVGWSFSNNPPNNQEVQAVCQLPHAWREASTVHAHIHWYLTVGGGGGEDVKWDLLYRVASIGGTFPAGWTTLPTTVDVSGYAVREHIYTDLGDITMAGEGVSCIVDIRLQRDTADAADDHEQDVILKEIDFHIRKDAFGSVQETSKWG